MFRKFRVLGLVVVCFIIIFSFVGCATNDGEVPEKEILEDNSNGNSDKDVSQEVSSETIVMRLAENQPDNNPVTQSLVKFAELVDEKTKGEIEIDVYANGQLGEESEMVDQVQAGSVEMVRASSLTLADTIKEINVFNLPFIFNDQEHKYKVLDGEIGAEVLEKFEDYGFVGLSFLDAGSRSFYTAEKPVKSLADLKGQKFRVLPSDVLIKMTELLGAVPTPIEYSEVFSAVQTGVVDGAENDFVSYYTSGHYEVAKHYTLSEHLSAPAIVLVNKDFWDSLSNEHQDAIKESAKEAAEWQRQAMNDFQDESREKAEESGCTIYEVDKKEFQEAVAPIYDDFPEFKDTIEEIRGIN